MAKTDQCRSCKRTLPLTDFCVVKSRKRGYGYICKKCQTTRSEKSKHKYPERVREYTRKYYWEHKEEMDGKTRVYIRSRYKNDPEFRERIKSQNDRWKKSPQGVQKTQEARQRYKDRVFAAYGGYVCSCCGIEGEVFMTIDHINGRKNKAAEENSMRGNRLWAWLTRNDFPKGFQILCWNCNSAKHIKGTCPHQCGN